MFSKEEARQLRQLFWTSFGKSFPRKWILYNTKVKDLSLKFHADTKTALVCLDITHDDPELRQMYFEKLQCLEAILSSEFIPKIIYDKEHYLQKVQVI